MRRDLAEATRIQAHFTVLQPVLAVLAGDLPRVLDLESPANQDTQNGHDWR